MPKLCFWFVQLVVSVRTNHRMEPSRLTDLFYFEPGGTSIKNLNHWVQLYSSKVFRMYDYGEAKNIQIYGQKEPPTYDTEKFRHYNIKSFLTYSDNDSFSYPQDLDTFVKLIPEETRNQVITIKVKSML